MEATWYGTIEELKNATIPYVIEGVSPEAQEQCWDEVRALPYADDSVIIGMDLESEWVHCILQTPYYWLVIRFIDTQEPTAVDWDKLAIQTMRWMQYDGVRGSHVYGVILSSTSDKIISRHQMRAIPLQQLETFVTALNKKLTWAECDARSLDDVKKNDYQSEKERRYRHDQMQQLTDRLFEGLIATAEEYATILKKRGYVLYMTQNWNELTAYFDKRKAEMVVFTSAHARNLTEFEKEQNDFANGNELIVLTWGDDLRWLGQWRQTNDQIIEFYRRVLLNATEGVVIYIPSTVEMMGTYRLLGDAGFDILF